MAPTTRPNAGSMVVAALVVLIGVALVAGPAVAQETTDDGMSGNETMSDGNETMGDGMDGDESMDDGTGENETMDDDSTTEDEMMDDNESMDDGMGTETMGDDSMTEEGQMGDEEQMDDETASGGQPGFGVVVALAAVVAAAFVLYRRRG